MSIQLPVTFYKGDKVVHRGRTVGGYIDVKSDEELIRQVIDQAEFDAEWLKKYKRDYLYPEWDRFVIDLGDRQIEHHRV
jgi:DNA-dependent RNA polymerase auxiliary subunit epsilon